jgi:hypothetical protein
MADRPRRVMGLFLGLGMGLIYGLVSLNINAWVMPQIPLAQPIFGKGFHLGLYLIEWGLLGFFTAFPAEAIAGILLGAFAATTFSSVKSAGWAYLEGESLRMSVLLLVTFLPRMLASLPVTGVIRWIFHQWEKELGTLHFSVWKLAGWVILAFFLAGAGGAFSLHSGGARTALLRTNELILMGREAETEDELPAPLLEVDGFFAQAQADYTLRLTDDLENLPIPRPFAGFGETEYGVIVQFSSGFRFGCIWTLPRPNPSCNEY